ncbi:chemotaxis-specific protein-glutamate methyltransferase CheB [Sorangium cellulosum]|uniref:Protein-glutamate methylesterase/protein-glutamine glutaminase n=1 Tax=Sorangium cellulosum TaxID=56 RepID=A0A150QKN5_SORCE|nr:chemotaxis-specific protein-glutamate methyltransferase CheB [Sorangium cellulosum]KYF68565.1 chemotaxis response regulator protein-glutamate methylesterase [Sorangium cellulosum]
MKTPPVRVLVVDDSAFVRKVLRQVLGASPSIEVVDTAMDGLDALEKIARYKPDVITLDLVMPNLDGIGVLGSLPRVGAPRVVVVSNAEADSELGVRALQQGAIEIVEKPTSLATDRLFELSDELVRKVLAAAVARPPSAEPRLQAAPPPPALIPVPARTRLIVVGASTGGPQALTRLLTALPAELPVPVVVALHIPAGYTESLARRLDEASAISVVEASNNLELRPGRAVIARGGQHLEVRRHLERASVHFAQASSTSLYCPSVDLLFSSAAAAIGSGVLAVVLTGMGDDGLVGSREIHKVGGRILAEAESSCVVYGMPRRVHEAGLAVADAPIDEMPALILRHL